MSVRFKWWAIVLIGIAPSWTVACTAPSTSAPEIEIEPEWEDYDPSRDRLLYKIAVEVEVAAPTQLTTCQCGLGLGNTSNPAPPSFDVIGALVAVRPDNGLDLDLEAFAGFSPDGSVANTFTNLPGFNNGGAAYGFSAEVAPFIPPILNPNEHLIMAFLVEFAPADFDAVSGNFLQFAAGSTDPGHQLSLFNNYQSNVVLPPYSLEPCDFNFDQECNVDDINALMSLGTLNSGVPLTNANQRFDLNGDGIIDMQDVDEWLQGAAAFNGIPSAYKYGDANLDGMVDGTDFNIWNQHKFDEAANWDEGNFNGDGVIDGGDFNAWNANKFTSSLVPEPTSYGLMLLAAVAFRARKIIADGRLRMYAETCG